MQGPKRNVKLRRRGIANVPRKPASRDVALAASGATSATGAPGRVSAMPDTGSSSSPASARQPTASASLDQSALLAVTAEPAPTDAAPTRRSPAIPEAHAAPHAPRGPLRQRAEAIAWTAWDQVRHLTVEQWLWIAVIALGAILRFWGLGDKPLHHDESMHAYFSLAFAKDPASYAYNPLLHGPFQFHAEGMMMALLMGLQNLFVHGVAGNPWINDTTARFVPALFGLGIVALPYGLRRDLGRVPALIAAFLLAISPSFVYFSRFLREDIYFNFFMFAMVIAAVRYAHERTMKRFIQLFAATVLAYATFEGTFLTLAIFGGFLAMLAFWELAAGLAKVLPSTLSERERTFFSRAGLLLLLGAFASLLAVISLGKLNDLSNYINLHPNDSAVQVQRLEDTSVAIVLYASIFLALLVIGSLVWQMYRDDVRYALADTDDLTDLPGDELPEDIESLRRRQQTVARIDAVVRKPGAGIAWLRAKLDPERQPFLHLLLDISWVHWFVAFVVGWMIFAALYWIVPGQSCVTFGQCFQKGIGSGMWQGLYYWLEQQKVARGGQPIYYYFLLIPLYEQLALVFGLAGAVYALVRPTRFRLFLVWWFVASLGLYSWAGEKMPWLVIHILLPLMLLAGIALSGVVSACWELIQRIAAHATPRQALTPRTIAGVLGAVAGLALLIPMLHSMLVLTQQDAANGPLEMMVYVQTTPDVDAVMAKITEADQKMYGGQHKLRIAIGAGEEWPFYWYLRDYTNVSWDYNAADPNSPPEDVLILLPSYEQNHSDGQTFMSLHPNDYQMKHYKLRSWFDESYKPQPCVPSKTTKCSAADNWGSGVGLGNYLSYGTFPPAHATFNLGKATNRLWNWLWFRKPLGDTGGSYDFVFIVHKGVPVQP